MLAYYDGRAPEYEEAYTAGTGTASITDPAVFTTEIAMLARVVAEFGQGHLLDLACGTGYWLPHYAPRCSRVTLLDQSPRMLRECERKVDALALAGRCRLICGDVFEHELEDGEYDTVLAGFFLSHVHEADEGEVFDLFRRVLRPGGRFLVLDSAWTDLRRRFNGKSGRQRRLLNDGTPFEIYKRYIDSRDIAAWGERHRASTRIDYFGQALCAVSGTFAD